jgi:hypothetical protein
MALAMNRDERNDPRRCVPIRYYVTDVRRRYVTDPITPRAMRETPRGATGRRFRVIDMHPVTSTY